MDKHMAFGVKSVNPQPAREDLQKTKTKCTV
jgi:hypothetical protein